MPLLAQRRRENVLCAFETRGVEVIERKIEILRARLGINRQAAIASLAHFFERLVATQMNDVQRRSGHFGKSNRSRDGLRLGGRGAGQGMILWRSFSLRQCLLNDHVNGTPIFSMHADESTVL